jgi:CYTH domain-containing protein
MAIEIERKFLVVGDGWLAGARASRIEQGYLSNNPEVSVRIRIRDERATITVKGERSGLSRDEFEYPVPIDDARAMMELCVLPPLAKTRHDVIFAGKMWEVDVYSGRHAGMVIAEIELASEADEIELPPWVGLEVTHDRRYRNSELAGAASPPIPAA